jgi:hypothetical protein
MATKLQTLLSLAALLTGGTALADEARGVIDRVDRDRGELVLQARGRGMRGLSVTFVLTDQTQVEAGGKPTGLADLQPGKHARVLYQNRDGQRVALGVKVRGIARAVATARPGTNAPADADTVTGTLIRVALTDREVVVAGPGPNGEGEETVVSVPENTRITRGDQVVAFKDLKQGERVVIRTRQQQDRLEAVSIQVGQAVATPAPDRARDERIDCLRRVLRFVDFVLQQMQDRREEPQK